MEALSELLYKLILCIILYASCALSGSKSSQRGQVNHLRMYIVQRTHSVDQIPVQRMQQFQYDRTYAVLRQ